MGRPRDARTVTRRRRFAATLLCAVAVTALLVGGRIGSDAAHSRAPAHGPSRSVEVTAGGRMVLRLAARGDNRPRPAALQRLLARRLPGGATRRRGRARLRYRYDAKLTARRVLRAWPRGGRVAAARIALSSTIVAPVVRQSRRNTCESAALEVLLATVGLRVPQERLQAAFPRSGALDPQGTGTGRVWGDPDVGYVGRADGGGIAGGFGIYPRPVAQTARRFGRRLDDLTAGSPGRVYARLLAGRAVMAWIGLSDGPYGEWRSPRGRAIRVNFGEHTVVLTGIRRDGDLQVVNPLQGTLESWSRSRFEAAWELLGRRALGA